MKNFFAFVVLAFLIVPLFVMAVGQSEELHQLKSTCAPTLRGPLP